MCRSQLRLMRRHFQNRQSVRKLQAPHRLRAVCGFVRQGAFAGNVQAGAKTHKPRSCPRPSQMKSTPPRSTPQAYRPWYARAKPDRARPRSIAGSGRKIQSRECHRAPISDYDRARQYHHARARHGFAASSNAHLQWRQSRNSGATQTGRSRTENLHPPPDRRQSGEP